MIDFFDYLAILIYLLLAVRTHSVNGLILVSLLVGNINDGHKKLLGCVLVQVLGGKVKKVLN